MQQPFYYFFAAAMPGFQPRFSLFSGDHHRGKAALILPKLALAACDVVS